MNIKFESPENEIHDGLYICLPVGEDRTSRNVSLNVDENHNLYSLDNHMEGKVRTKLL